MFPALAIAPVPADPFMFNMNGSARPAYKHYLLYLPPFDLTDRLETRQQTLVLLLCLST
jgi:hypothetical protein